MLFISLLEDWHYNLVKCTNLVFTDFIETGIFPNKLLHKSLKDQSKTIKQEVAKHFAHVINVVRAR